MTKEQAIKWAGGTITELARRLGITHGAVCKWGPVPIKHQYRLSEMSDGELVIDVEERRLVKAGKK